MNKTHSMIHNVFIYNAWCMHTGEVFEDLGESACNTADPIKDALFDVETIEDTNTVKVSHVKLIHFEDVTLAKDDVWSFAH